MDNSTNQELNRMTVRHRLFSVVISTLFGFSAFVLTAQDVDETEDSSSVDQITTTSDASDVLDAEPFEDQFTKEFLEELSKEEFTAYILEGHKYSKNDQDALLQEYQRRCSDDSTDSSSDLCPDEIEPNWGDTEQIAEETELNSDESEEEGQIPKLEEETVEVRVARPNESTENVADPRRNNKPSDQKQLVPAWRNK
ncbi:MAG: hypothetical protein OXH31_07425 [Gammaproteobacteria bacterium]|nr:hypothetical protein [Gammaproteobacteria bacterium]